MSGSPDWKFVVLLLHFSFPPTVYADEFVAHFPEDCHCGFVTSCRAPYLLNGFEVLGHHESVITPAKGTLRLASDKWLLLDVVAGCEDPVHALKGLPADSFRGIRVRGATVDRTLMRQICGLRSMEFLAFEDCTIVAGAFEDLPKSELLRSLVLYSDTSSDVEVHLISWMLNCPALHYVYVQSDMSLTGLRTLSRHPRIAFINARVGRHGREQVSALANFKNLEGINLNIGHDADANFLKSLPELKRVRWINWGGGRCGENELHQLAKISSLESLVLQGNVELPKDFILGVGHMKQLQRLAINTGRKEFDQSRLVDALSRLPNLRYWPTVYSISRRDLELLQQRQDIVSIQVYGDLASDVDRAAFWSYLGGLRLEHLVVRQEAPEDLGFLSGQVDLVSLRISATELSGAQLSPLTTLTNLQQLQLYVNGYSDLTLAPLAGCAALESLIVSGELLRPIGLNALSQNASLKRLELHATYLDDSSVEALLLNSSVTRLSLGQNCTVTARIVDVLSKNKQIETLSIGGSLSIEDAMKVAALPNLRRLTLRSPHLNPGHSNDLLRRNPALSLSLLPYNPTRGTWNSGTDGILRTTDLHADTVREQMEGQTAPPIRADEIGGDQPGYSTEDDIGHVVLLDFWGVWCGPCLALKPTLKGLHDRYASKGLRIVSVHSQQGAEGLTKYMEVNVTPWKVLLDSDGEFARQYGVMKYPTLYLIDKQGTLRAADPHVFGLSNAIEKLLAE